MGAVELMDGLTQLGYMAHAKLPRFQRLLADTLACITEALEISRAPFVAYSAGKDSTAMLWLCLQVTPSIPVRILTGGETRLLHSSLDQVLAWWPEHYPGIDLVEINVDHVFADGWRTVDFWTQWASFHGEWSRYLHSAGDWDGVFLGLRAEESNIRRLHLGRHISETRQPIYRYTENRDDIQAGHYRICPLARWTTQDIGALIASHDLPLLDTYAVGGLEQRTHTRVGYRSVRYGQLEELRARDPESYQRLLDRFPELDELHSKGG